jgi:hypothetical protein
VSSINDGEIAGRMVRLPQLVDQLREAINNGKNHDAFKAALLLETEAVRIQQRLNDLTHGR